MLPRASPKVAGNLSSKANISLYLDNCCTKAESKEMIELAAEASSFMEINTVSESYFCIKEIKSVITSSNDKSWSTKS